MFNFIRTKLPQLNRVLNFKALFFVAVFTGSLSSAGVIAELSNRDVSAKASIDGSTIPFDTLFSITVVLNKDSNSQDLINFDAIMPSHNHGMVLKPKIVRVGPKEWRIDGVKLHMKGSWRLTFEWQGKLKKSKTTYDLVI